MTNIQIFAFVVLPLLIAGTGYFAVVQYERARREPDERMNWRPAEQSSSTVRLALQGALAGATLLHTLSAVFPIAGGSPHLLGAIGGTLGFLAVVASRRFHYI